MVDKYTVAAALGARCELCGADGGVDGRALCPGCEADLAPAPQHCRCCTRLLAEPGLCRDCQRSRERPLRVWYACDYERLAATLVHRFKFGGRFEMALALAGIMRRRLPAPLESWPEVLVPVPLHRRRLVERGYDQAAELALALGSSLAVPVRCDLLRRARSTEAQSLLDVDGRRRNVAGAFALRRPVPYRRVALIDDVVTTGATAAAAARALSRQGGVAVMVWAFAGAGR